MAIPPKLDRRYALFEGIRKASIGTEPANIDRAGEALRRFAPLHPTLSELELRLRRAQQIRGSSIGSANYRLKLDSQKSRAHTALQRDPLFAGGDRVQLAVISALPV